MDARQALERFLTTDPRDATCAETFDLIHAYAEMVVRGDDPERELPGVTAHLRQCPPCREDFDGLLAALRGAVGAS